jgi:hypothetical protein
MATKSKTKNKKARARARKVKESHPDTRFFLDWDMMDNKVTDLEVKPDKK